MLNFILLYIFEPHDYGIDSWLKIWLIDWLIFGVLTIQQYFNYIFATSFSGWRSRSTQIESPTMALKSENQLYEQYLLPRAVGKIINGQTAKIYDTCQADIIFAVDDYRKDYALWRTHWNITLRDKSPTTLCNRLGARTEKKHGPSACVHV
jgi:hypothetical protein